MASTGIRDTSRDSERERPQWQLTLDLGNYYRNGFSKAKMLSGQQRTVPMVFYELEVKELFSTLLGLKMASEEKPTLAEELASGDFWGSVK